MVASKINLNLIMRKFKSITFTQFSDKFSSFVNIINSKIIYFFNLNNLLFKKKINKNKTI